MQFAFNFPLEKMIVASFFGGQGYLISVWLTILFHDWTFNFLGKGEKSSNYPFEKILGSGVSYIKGRY